jgi:hypothetical protein
LRTARNIAKALSVLLAYLYCEENEIAGLLLTLSQVVHKRRASIVSSWIEELR